MKHRPSLPDYRPSLPDYGETPASVYHMLQPSFSFSHIQYLTCPAHWAFALYYPQCWNLFRPCRIYSIKTSALFTPQGTKYYHMFNISVCPKDSSLKASCHRNVSMEGNAQVCSDNTRLKKKQGPLRNVGILYYDLFSTVTLMNEFNPKYLPIIPPKTSFKLI